MSRAEPKRKQLSLGVGKYYNPVTSRASLKHNARVAFLQAVENKTPEVLNSLHHDVWHFYESIYWRVSAPESEEDWLYSIHPGIVSDWFTGRPAANWTPRSRPALNRLKKALFAWASNYNIFAGWTIMYALDAMMFWAAYQSFPDHRRKGRWLRTRTTCSLVHMEFSKRGALVLGGILKNASSGGLSIQTGRERRKTIIEIASTNNLSFTCNATCRKSGNRLVPYLKSRRSANQSGLRCWRYTSAAE